MKLKTTYWTKDDPEARIKPFWILCTFSMVNTGWAIFTYQNILAIMNGIFLLTSIMAILSYNKYRKEKEGDKKDGDTQTKQENTSKTNPKPI